MGKRRMAWMEWQQSHTDAFPHVPGWSGWLVSPSADTMATSDTSASWIECIAAQADDAYGQ